MDLSNAVVVITGGVGGIGSAFGEAFARAGAASVSADLPGHGADIDLDVTDVDATRRALSELRANRGRLEVVIANAGIGVGGLAEDVSVVDWDRCIDVNVRGTANTVQAAYPLLVEARGRRWS